MPELYQIEVIRTDDHGKLYIVRVNDSAVKPQVFFSPDEVIAFISAR